MTEGEIVEALEEGRVVRVSEEYAKREGLLILRRPKQDPASQRALNVPLSYKERMSIKEGHGRRKSVLDLDKFRKPLKHEGEGLYADLIDNFHWKITEKRKTRGMNRKQLAQALGENEESIKLIENGILPSANYILLNKIENYFGINLRKGSGLPVSPIMSEKVEGEKNEEKSASEKEEDVADLLGEEIDIDE